MTPAGLPPTHGGDRARVDDSGATVRSDGDGSRALLQWQRTVGNHATARALASLQRYPDATAAKTATGLSDSELAVAVNGMTLDELEAFTTAVGSARVKELVVTRQLPGEVLKHYGADALREVAVTDDTMRHVVEVESFDNKKGVVGGHDEQRFRAKLTDPSVTRRGRYDTGRVTAKGKKEYDTTTTTFVGYGEVTAETPSAGDAKIKHLVYKTYAVTADPMVIDAADATTPKWKAGFEKTVIENLETDRAVWQGRANEALFDAIRRKAANLAGGSFQGDSGTYRFTFWARNGQINTFYPAL